MMLKTRYLALLLLILGACRSGPAPAGPAPTGPAPAGTPESPEPALQAEDPEAPVLGISETRPIHDMHRRTFGFLETGVWISNEFPGGRASDAWREDDTYVVQLEPENAPVNNSAWYAFKIWSRAPDTVPVRLTYEGGDHRYWPKVRGVDGTWVRMDSSAVSLDRERNEASLRLAIGPDTLWVAGQEMMTSASFEAWTDSLARQDHVTGEVIGRSGRGRPILMAEFGNEDASRHVMVIGRQHPPEATGTMALLAFVEELAGDAPLAREFRSEFRVHVVPLVNPDGVDLGHWRHNTGGVDLNRDWEAFNQPETRVVRDAFSAILAQPGHELWFGVDFHSTQYDVFYTLDRELATDPPDILDPWLDYIGTHLPDYEVNDSPSGLDTPMSRNWFYRAFGAPALIYEVGDQTDRALIREVAETAARGTMAVLLEALHRRMPPDAGLPG